MKGILVKDNNKWWVRYTQHSPLWPVHPNNMILPLLPEQNKIASSVTETYDIEFEIVEFNKPGSSYNNADSKYAKLVLQPKQDIEKLAEDARTELNEHVYCCSGEVEEHAFDMGFVSGYYKGKGSLDLKKMESERDNDIEELAKKEYPDGIDGTNRSSEIYRRIFIEAYNKAKESYEIELADIRNKLGPLKNLIQMIERGHIVPDDKLKELVDKSIPVCKGAIDYIANGKFKINDEQKTA